VGKNDFLNASSQTRRLNTTPAALPEETKLIKQECFLVATK
jgi:hypothetical protein